MVFQLQEVPNEVVCHILDYLPTQEKFRAREVCKRWRDQVDVNVPFHIRLRDSTYEDVCQRFGKRRVASLQISQYTRPNIPIQNLCSLRRLTVINDINEAVINELLTKAIFLDTLTIKVHYGAMWEEQTSAVKNTFPALNSVKHLYFDVICYETDLRSTLRACSMLIDHPMPNLQSLTVRLLTKDITPEHGLEYFSFAASKPTLRKFAMKAGGVCKRIDKNGSVSTPPLPVTPALSSALSKLRLTHVHGCVLQMHEKAWEVLLSQQQHLEQLQMYSGVNSGQGFPISLALPAIVKSRESLRSIAIEIDTKRGGDPDLRIFANLKSLRDLHLKVWEKKQSRLVKPQKAPIKDMPNASNLSSLIKPTLRNFCISGFKYADSEVTDLIAEIAKQPLGRIEITRNEHPSIWENFDARVREMGLEEGAEIDTFIGYSQTNRFEVWLVLVPKGESIPITMFSNKLTNDY